MPSLADHTDALREIAEEWDKAEKDIKIAEQIAKKVAFPSIKELRYAGRRLVDLIRAEKAGDEESVARVLADAVFNCYRARHDAVDVTVSAVSVEMDLVAKKLGYHAVLQGFPAYRDLLLLIQSAQSQIVDSRAKRDDRDAIYSSVENAQLDQIVGLFREFKSSEALIRGLARQARRNSLVGWSIGIAGIVVGVLIALFV